VIIDTTVLVDCPIGVAAFCHSVPLVPLNEKHFRFVPGLMVSRAYRPFQVRLGHPRPRRRELTEGDVSRAGVSLTLTQVRGRGRGCLGAQAQITSPAWG